MSDSELTTRDDRAAVEKAFALLKAFGDDAYIGLGVSEIARRADLSKSTAFRLLKLLQVNGLLERSGRGYRFSTTLDGFGSSSPRNDHDSIRETLTPVLVDLYEATHASVNLAVLSDTDVLCVSKLHGRQVSPSPIRLGSRIPAYCTAVGKTLLANDALATARTLALPRRRWTPTTLAGESELTNELDRVRSEGIALDKGESLANLSCIAIPVFGRTGRAVAAISLSTDTASFSQSRFEHTLRQAGYLASRQLATREYEGRASVA